MPNEMMFDGEEPRAIRKARPYSVQSRLAVEDALLVERQNMAWLRKHAPAAPEVPSWGKRAGVVAAALRLDRAAWARIRLSLAWRLGLARFEPEQDEDEGAAYQDWIRRFDRLGRVERDLIAMHVAAQAFPHISAYVQVGAEIEQAEGVLRGLLAQVYPSWSACLLVPAGLDADRLRAIREAATVDGRVTVAVAGEEGARPCRPGSYVLVMETNVVLRPHTFYGFAEAASRNRGARLFYADEDRIDGAGRRGSPAFKPAFSPELNRRVAYLGGCALLAGSEEVVAGFTRYAAAGGSVPEWIATVADGLTAEQVVHVPRLLFHSRSDPMPPRATPTAASGGGVDGESVAVIIPTKNHVELLRNCVASLQQTRWPEGKLEIIIVDNGSDDAEAVAYLSELERGGGLVTVIRDPRPFNYSQLNNEAVRQTRAELLVFLNNDTEALTPLWLEELAAAASAPAVAFVGCKLLYPDRTVQHGGVVLGGHAVAAHSFVGLGAEEGGYLGLANLTRDMPAVTGACMAVRRAIFAELGGFDENLLVAFNDTVLCLRAIERGYRNIYLARPLFVHHESKTRGFDTSPEKLVVRRRECIYTREKFPGFFWNDPSYNPNLSLDHIYGLGILRVSRPWASFRRRSAAFPRVLLLSAVHGVGHGVAVVLQQHAQFLAERGFQVFVGGPQAEREIVYEGCHRVYLDDETEAASFAVEAEIDCVMAHTMPFFAMVKLLGPWPRFILYDHGEPRPEWFADRERREALDAEKRFYYRLATRVLTISEVVREESGFEGAGVLTHGNAHLATWDSARGLSRPGLRKRLGFAGHVVALNVCRFHEGERRYKGIDEYIGVLQEIRRSRPELKVKFVLCGKGSEDDRRAMEEAGLEVFANLGDAELADMYVAADLYMNFSKWEGYNLGIGQALAMGLPVIASDIPAHRAFPIATSDRVTEQVAFVLDVAASHREEAAREAVIFPWEDRLLELERTITALCLED